MCMNMNDVRWVHHQDEVVCPLPSGRRPAGAQAQAGGAPFVTSTDTLLNAASVTLCGRTQLRAREDGSSRSLP